MSDDTKDVPEARARTEVAGYRVVRMLGRGGMAVVYLAEHDWLQRKVALKVLAPQLAEDEHFRERFVRESRLAASLDHPNVVPIYEAGASGGDLFIAMRYVEGTDLRTLLARTGALEPERAIAICRQVAAALDAAHEQGLVHRDVKPGNVLVARARGSEAGEHVYLSDFGLTKRSTSDSGITGTGQFVGTLNYAAPEQFFGGTADARTDVYSLGCVLFECLTGHPPFQSDNDPGLMYAHLQEAPPAVTADRPDLPPAIDGVVARAMAKKREDRQPTAGALVEEAAQGLRIGVPSRDDGSGERRSPLPWLVAVAAVVVALVGAVMVTSLVQGNTSAPAVAAGHTSPPASPSPTAAPAFRTADRSPSTDEELRLLDAIPDPVKGDCSPLDRDEPLQGELAALVCRTPDVEVLYELFPTQDAMNAAFQTSANSHAAPDGECATDHVAVSEYSINGEAAGQVLCYTIDAGLARDSVGEPSRSHVEWTDENTSIYAHAVRNDLGDLSLYEWWLTEAGPLPAESSPSELAKDRPVASVSPPEGSYMSNRGACARFGTCVMHMDGSTYQVSNYNQSPFTTGQVTLRKPGLIVFTPGAGVCFDRDRSTGPVTNTWTDTGDSVSFEREGGGRCGGPAFANPWTRAPKGQIALEEGGEIEIIDGGGALIESTTERATNPNIAPDWSPDGSEIAYAGAGEQGFDLYVIAADGSGQRRITRSASDEETPSWSPDATRIAYAFEGGGESSSESGLFMIDPDGQDSTELVPGQDSVVWDPIWSPDGREIVYTIFFHDGDDPRMYVVDPSSGRSQPLPRPEGIALTWLQGGRIIFADDGALMSRQQDGSGQRVLLHDLPADIRFPFADLSPDGRWMLVSNWWNSPGLGHSLGVYLISVDGGEAFRITSGTEASWRPTANR